MDYDFEPVTVNSIKKKKKQKKTTKKIKSSVQFKTFQLQKRSRPRLPPPKWGYQYTNAVMGGFGIEHSSQDVAPTTELENAAPILPTDVEVENIEWESYLEKKPYPTPNPERAHLSDLHTRMLIPRLIWLF
jgi:hypothetical protein